MPTSPSVTVSEDERSQLWVTVHRGKTNARTLKRAQVLLKVADGWTAAESAEALDVSPSTVATVCRRFREGGVEAVLHDQRQAKRRQALTGGPLAHLVAIACTDAPDGHGHGHWTVRLLAGKAVELGYVRSISPATIRQALKPVRDAALRQASVVAKQHAFPALVSQRSVPVGSGVLVAWSLDGQTLAVAADTSDHGVALYDCASGRQVSTLAPPAATGSTTEVRTASREQGEAGLLRWSPDGSRLSLLDAASGALTIWHV